ncbi:11183_t:CDS:1, partial [Gigaspora rosea]
KDKDDEIKLWREANNGMYWAHKSTKPDQDEFGIVAIQVAGSIIRLNVLIRD